MICPRCVVRTLAAQESAAAARTWHEHGVCTCPVIFPLGGAAARAGVLKTHLPAGALFRTVVVAATALQMNCVAGERHRAVPGNIVMTRELAAIFHLVNHRTRSTRRPVAS
jgi:hypothetical protein